ncbi:3' terminal RNA ribose 2'-O-methyltransferase Hen1 [Nocardia otitidiscaviarum]|uniref:3' terminal RNA ribose 2'-O-methyltransferase Hen1 n=1 Tax=Nocardia otitidiscaviarum TaxID=1823 RepID=UPI00069390A6|nr:3' terminal RNA ribose 2'-O-methyltransferase Hen1 [Nocardia otitidiscaviarum]MBF6133098.1 3' terminal RNA ribose 2'-O-methyltransferase Hen1 [Nocardia otitidiscaviarum]MBF6486494.1 3' terminal RNA ribose 2'-O-methyltransferase Hen1 [Nocardia otitidiscaviarum]
MLLTITCTRPEDAAWTADDLGYLLHKNPAKVQAFEQSYGMAHVLYPEATAQRCTAALLLEVDPVRLVRGKQRGTPEFSLAQYVNDRPYAASSLLSVAIAKVFGSALHGRCAQRPELPDLMLPLRIDLPAVPCKGGPEAAERVFAPLGWTVVATPLPLDPAFPEWGESHYLRLELTGALRLADALAHLYVLLPVLDGSKHYWLDTTEIDKLLRFGAGWLADHPEREWITRRYLSRRHTMVRAALARLAEVDDLEPEDLGAVEEDVDDATDAESATSAAHAAGGHHAGNATGGAHSTDAAHSTGGNSSLPSLQPVVTASPPATSAPHHTATTGATTAAAAPAPPELGIEPAEAVAPDASVPDIATPGTEVPSAISADAATGASAAGAEPRPLSLAVTRRAAVIRALREVGAQRVLDLGCGEGALLRELVADRAFTEIVGVDVAVRSLHIAKRRVARLPQWQARRVSLRQGALTYTDASLRGYDAAVLMEVIEHVDASRLRALEHAVFGSAAPGAVLVTTPNGEYNALYEGLPAGKFRHADHRFEWSRSEFAAWAHGVAETYGYAVRFVPIGPEDDTLGPPTQMAVFTKPATDDTKGVVS